MAKWNYVLPEIYFLAIMNFKFDNSHPDHFIHDVRLLEVNTCEEFYPKLAYVFIEMPKFNKSEDELESELDEWLEASLDMRRCSKLPK